MASRRESLLAPALRAVQVPEYLTWQVWLVVMAGIALLNITVKPSGPVTDLILPIAIMIWSIVPLVQWRQLTWSKRLAAISGTVFAADLMAGFIVPSGFDVGRRIVIAAVILAWSALWLVLPPSRWRHLTWTKWLLAIGCTVMIAGLVLAVIEPSSLLILIVAVVIFSALLSAERHHRTWPMRLLAVAAFLFLLWVVVTILTESFTHSQQVHITSIAATLIWYTSSLSALLYLLARRYRITAPPMTWALVIIGILFLDSFPPLLAFLSTNGNANFGNLVLQGFELQSSLLGSAQFLLLISVPVLLILVPQILRGRLAGAEKSTAVEALLLSQLTIVAALATALYAITLHFAKGPLNKLSANQLVFAAIAVAILLGPFYKSIVTACWKHGIADTFNLGNWLARQAELFQLLQKAATAAIESKKPADSASHASAPSGTEADTITSSRAGASQNALSTKSLPQTEEPGILAEKLDNDVANP
jgi:hypothetical protein